MFEDTEKIGREGYSVFSDVDEVVLSVDSEGRIIKFNEASERLSGYSRDDALDKFFIDFLVPNRYSGRWRNVFETIKKNKLIDDFRLPLLTKNGHEIMISWSSFPVKDDMGVVRDITFVGRLVSSWEDAKEPPVDVSSSVGRNIDGYDDFYKIFRDLERRNKELEKKNEELEEKIKKLKGKSGFTSVFSGFIGKSKKEEIEKELSDLEKRKRLLDELEAKLNEERRSLNEQRKWFVKWREKLESLEYEIENRRRNLADLNRLADEQVVVETDNAATGIESKVDFDVESLDDIPNGAAVIQRGILKKVNDAFAELLGYNVDEIVNKSLFDFISPEGFSGIEDYYLHRLKGDSVSSYDTMFLTKNNSKVSVEVETKPIVFNGDKAELAVFKKVKEDKNEKD